MKSMKSELSHFSTLVLNSLWLAKSFNSLGIVVQSKLPLKMIEFSPYLVLGDNRKIWTKHTLNACCNWRPLNKKIPFPTSMNPITMMMDTPNSLAPVKTFCMITAHRTLAQFTMVIITMEKLKIIKESIWIRRAANL